MKTILILLAMCGVSSAADFDAIRAATVKIKGADGNQCSGIVVSPEGDMLSAEHCQLGDGVEVIFPDGKRARGKLEYDPPRNNTDEATRWRLTGGPWPYVKIAKAAPRIGDKVHSAGYPTGTFSYVEGKVTNVSGGIIFTDATTIEGHSGGPLFNESDELVGLCTGYVEGREAGIWIGLDSIQKSMGAVVNTSLDKGTVIVFSFANLKRCPPCANLMSEIGKGFMKEYEVKICKLDDQGKWDSSESTNLYREFRTGPGAAENGLPVVWVYWTGSYKAGFDPARKASLLTFIGGVIDAIGQGLIGQQIFPDPPRTTPVPRSAIQNLPPSAGIPVPEVAPPVPVEGEASSDGGLRDTVAELKAELKSLKEGTLLEKFRAIDALHESVGGLKDKVSSVEGQQICVGDLSETVAPLLEDIDLIKNGNMFEKAGAIKDAVGRIEEVKETVQSVKNASDSNPHGFWGLLPGLAIGLAKRRYQSRKHDEVA